MTPRSLAYEALAYILVSGGSNPNATLANATTRQKERIANDLTATMEDIYTALPWFFRRPEGGTLAASQAVTVSVTNGSTAITYGGTIVNGQTIAIGGVHYQIFSEAGTKRLDAAYAGATDAAASAVLYGDVLAIPSDVYGVCRDVAIRDGARLDRVTGRTGLYRSVREAPDYGRTARYETTKPFSGTPLRYMVETGVTNETAGHAERSVIRVAPMPTAQTGISYTALVKAPTFTVADLGDDNNDSTKTLVIPSNYHASIIRPIFLGKWISSPWFKDNDARKLLRAEETIAYAKMAELKKTKGSDLSFTPVY